MVSQEDILKIRDNNLFSLLVLKNKRAAVSFLTHHFPVSHINEKAKVEEMETVNVGQNILQLYNIVILSYS